jgi:crotonobetaine/carnitine-CoA ligase
VDSETASAGKTLPEFEVRVVDAADGILPVGEVGEIVIRTAETGIMMAGYDGDDDATAKAMSGGWYHSGDAGRFDEWGNLFFVSRIKDVIRVRGENVSAFEIEDALLSFPGVLEAAAIAVPCEMGGDEVKAVVVPVEGAQIDVHALVAHCDRQLPKFSVPRYVEVRGALPKTVTNKIQKNVLRAEGLNRLTWDRTTGSFLTANAEEPRDNH